MSKFIQIFLTRIIFNQQLEFRKKKERYITFLDFFVLDGIETLRLGIHCDCMKRLIANFAGFLFVFVLNKPNSILPNNFGLDLKITL